MSEIRASAIIPTYNRAELTVRAVESALAQTSPPIEILVVDDGSTDDTREAMAQFGSAVRYVYQPNAGVAAACNTGARQATGDWISFLDSDDVWLPSYFEQLVTAIETTEGAPSCTSRTSPSRAVAACGKRAASLSKEPTSSGKTPPTG
jgi:glycosyltransferase involved in cell wall biosynthesis